jgi:hypothetical protein
VSKRKLPDALRIRSECKREIGAEPFKPETAAQKKAIQACVTKKLDK